MLPLHQLGLCLKNEIKNNYFYYKSMTDRSLTWYFVFFNMPEKSCMINLLYLQSLSSVFSRPYSRSFEQSQRSYGGSTSTDTSATPSPTPPTQLDDLLAINRVNRVCIDCVLISNLSRLYFSNRRRSAHSRAETVYSYHERHERYKVIIQA
jgi:hypothetical protein